MKKWATYTEYEQSKDIKTLHIVAILATAISILLMTAILFSCDIAQANEWAIKTIAYEASNQPQEGKVMVASVIKARMKERNQNAKEVVLAPYQFSCWHPKTHKPTQKRTLTDKELYEAELAWRMATVTDYNHYARYDVKPYWIKSAKKQYRISDHIFYEL